MAVRLRMKQMGRAHRSFYRVCAMDQKTPRDGRVLEELGTYDPMIPETDARAKLDCERIDYWLGVGAQPSEKVRVLIKKYGTNGTHRDQQQSAIDQLSQPKAIPDAGKPASMPKKEEPAAEAAAAPTEAGGCSCRRSCCCGNPSRRSPSAEEATAPATEAPAAEAEAAPEAAAAEGEAKEETKEDA